MSRHSSNRLCNRLFLVASCKRDIFLCRQALRTKWLDLVAAAIQQGKARAKTLEQLYWEKYQAAVEVTTSGKVVDAKGKTFMPIDLEVSAI